MVKGTFPVQGCRRLGHIGMCACGEAITFQPCSIDADMCVYRDLTKTSNEKLVHSVNVGCNEGQVTWRFPRGGLRISFTLPPDDDDVVYDVCCVVSVTYCDVTLSLDTGDSLRVIAVLKSSSSALSSSSSTSSSLLSSEACFQWSRHRPVSLYAVTSTSQMSRIAGRIDVDYDVTSHHSTSRDMRGEYSLNFINK